MASSIQNFDLEHLTSAIADQVKAKLATKQDTLQLDASPSQNSTNFVNSGAVYTAIQEAMSGAFIGTTAEWNALTTAEKAEYDGKIVYITDDSSGSGGNNDDAIADIVNVYGAKNLNSYPYSDTTKTVNGITFTNNGDGSITANGTATASVNFFCHTRFQTDSNDLVIPNGKYIISGCPIGGSSSTYRIAVNRTHNGSASDYGYDYGSGFEFTLNGDDYSDDCVNLGIMITILNGATVNNVTFKPMLRLASIQDDTYVPYVPTNRQLLSHKDNGILGAKNLLPYPYRHTTRVSNGVTWTDNGDGTITASTGSGGATADTNFEINNLWSYTEDFDLDGKAYLLSGIPSGASATTYYIQALYKNSSNNDEYALYAENDSLIVAKANNRNHVGFRLAIKSGTVLTTPITFKPMLRLASDLDSTWQPYAMTNKKLTDAVSNLGTASEKDSTTSVTSGSADLVTSGAVYSYVDSKLPTFSLSGTTLTITTQ